SNKTKKKVNGMRKENNKKIWRSRSDRKSNIHIYIYIYIHIYIYIIIFDLKINKVGSKSKNNTNIYL
ncbi:hypothetical protein ACMBCM_06110, partial [Spiroplasma sp. K1]